jgi:hypothetical protein
MSRPGYNPETRESYRRLKMCLLCIHGFHLSCASDDCTCRALHSWEQWTPGPPAAREVPRRARPAGGAISH